LEYILKTKDLCKSYGKQRVLDNLNLNVPKGSIYGFVGKNGAGKTTLIRLVCGLQYPDSGEMEICGVPNAKATIARRKMGAIVETPSLHLNMTAKENLQIQFDTLGIKDYAAIDPLLEFVGLADTGKKMAKNFSLGMRQRLAIANAMCNNPEFLVLDEPINGLDPQGIIDIRELLIKINKEKGITILISSHILDELARVATHYGFIANGKIVAEMSAAELEASGQKRTTLHVNTTEKIDVAMSKFKNQYDINDNDTVDIFGDIVVTNLILALHEQGIVVSRLVECDESLEEHFFELLGGTEHA
jgi:ABC-2 type transport system ATP-binding protein